MDIREMTAADWPAVAEIYQQGIDTNQATFQTICPSYEEWDQAHLQACRLVIEDRGVIVGWSALTPVSRRPVYAGVAEVSIYIAPTHRGKGAGSLLLSALVEQSEQRGFWTLQSGIMPENAASVRLHLKCGFRQVGYRERIGKDRYGVWRDNLLLERRSNREEFGG